MWKRKTEDSEPTVLGNSTDLNFYFQRFRFLGAVPKVRSRVLLLNQQGTACQLLVRFRTEIGFVTEGGGLRQSMGKGRK
jgi:hypothetical protein